MAKALVLSEETLAEPVAQPRAAQTTKATPSATPAPKEAKPPKLPLVPLQIRIPPNEAKGIKRAALEADQTISDFMLACYHAYMKK
jgi:hypothetical protein